MEAFDYRDPALFTPMMAAVIRDDLVAFKAYVEQGWSVNNIDNRGNTPLHLSIILQKKEIFKYILSLDTVREDVQNFEQVTPLHMAAYHSNYEAAVALLALDDVDVNARDHELNTPLHLAAARDHLGLVQQLLKHGAEVNAINYEDKTAMMYACEENSEETVALLIERGALVHISHFVDDESALNRCPFFCALKNDNLDLVSFLYEYTFDQCDNALPLEILCELLPAWKHPAIEDLVARTGRLVVFDEKNEYTYLGHSCTEITTETLALLLRRFQPTMRRVWEDASKDWLLCWCRVVNALGESNEEAVWEKLRELSDNFDVMAEHGVLTDFCVALTPYPVIDTLVNFFHWTHKRYRPQLGKMVTMLLSYGMNLYSCDMLCLYNHEHYDVFKMCLHMDVLQLPESIPLRGAAILPLLIFDIPSTTLEKFYENPGNYTYHGRFQSFFGGQRLRRLLSSELMIPNVQSLCELARNSVRNAILANVQTCDQFHSAVKYLDIPQVAKEILTLDRKLYLSD